MDENNNEEVRQVVTEESYTQEVKQNEQVNKKVNDDLIQTHPINIIAMICGIVSVIGLLIPFKMGFLLSITAIILGLIGRKYAGKDWGRIGLICGIVVLIIRLILLGFIIHAFGWLFRGLAEYANRGV